MSGVVNLTYRKTLVSDKAKNAIVEFAYSGTFYHCALKTLEMKIGQPQMIVSAHLKNFPLSKCTNQKTSKALRLV